MPTPTAEVIRYDADGTLDLTYGNGGSAVGVVHLWADGNVQPVLALQGDGAVVVASETGNWDNEGYHVDAIVTRLGADNDIRPTQFGSEDAFRQYLIDQAIQQYSYLFGQPYYPPNYYPFGPIALASSAPIQTAAVSDGNSSYSTTNTQVAGVDEGDTVKTDGQYLYLLSNGNLVIMNAWPAADLQTLSVTSLTGNPLVEYLDGDRLTVITQQYPQEFFYPIEYSGIASADIAQPDILGRHPASYRHRLRHLQPRRADHRAADHARRILQHLAGHRRYRVCGAERHPWKPAGPSIHVCR